jgi:hypothetical protein
MTPRTRRPTILAAALSALLATWPAMAATGDTRALAVVGIVLGDGRPPVAAIEDPASTRTRFYRVGERVGAALVSEIHADRVILLTGGQRIELRLASVVAAPVSGHADPGAPTGGEPSRIREAAPSVEPPVSPYGRIVALAGGSLSPTPPGAEAGRRSLQGAGHTAGGALAGAGPGGGNGVLEITGRLHDGSSVQAEQFSTTSLRDLLFSMSFAGVGGATRQRLELYAPDGSLYQRLSGAVAPHTQTLLPVGGTWITEHALFGAWRVDLYVDRDRTPLASRTFTLVP